MSASSREIDAWFLSRGVPHFIPEYSASRDVLTRVVRLLVAVFLLEVLGALNAGWAWWGNLLAVLGGIVLVTGGWALLNRARGRRALERPHRVGLVEMVVFCLLPASLPLVFGGHAGTAAGVAAGNAALLGGIYLSASYGVVPMLWWGTRRMVSQIGSIASLGSRALPLLMVFLSFTFLAADVWQLVQDMPWVFVGMLLAVFLLAGTAFIASQLPRELRQIATFSSWEEVAALCERTPAADRAHELTGGEREMEEVPLTRRQWGNVVLVLLFSQAIQVLLVSLCVVVALLVIGVLAVSPEVLQSWTGVAPQALGPSIEVAGRSVGLSVELVKVALLLGGFAGLYFTVCATTDSTYRKEFYSEVVSGVRQAFAVRAVRVLGGGSSPRS